MSSNADGSDAAERPSREVAYRLFAAEFDDASLSYSESDEERAPNYVVTPSGARINRLFAVGVLTEVERVNDDVLRGRVVDPTGAFVSYAGQYQPDEMAFLDRASPPAFVALSGKARTFQPEDSDRVFTSVRPESLSRVDADTRDRWTVSAAEATLNRVGVMAAAARSGLEGDELRAGLEAAGVDASLASGVSLALNHYGTAPAYLAALRRLAFDALEVVAGDRDSVRALELTPGDAGTDEADLDALAADLDLVSAGPVPDADEAERVTAADSEAETDVETDAPTAAGSESAPGAAAGAGESEPADATPTDAAAVDTGEASTESETVPSFDAGAATESDSADAQPAGEDTVESPSAAEASGAAERGTESAPDETTDATADTPETSDRGAGDELGDFDTGGSTGRTDAADDPTGPESEPGTEVDVDTDVAGDEMYELDADEREEIEAEFGTEFSTGSEVDPAGEAGIDVPSVEELEDELDEDLGSGSGTADEPTGAADASTGQESTDAAETEPDDPEGTADATDVDVEAVAVEAMEELDDGDGASREAVVAWVVDEYGVAPGDVEDAIQSALMSGQCYEPAEDSLKAI
ncbi:hypothetical protein [Salinigranum marinum]|uniref:hypothetical protein n=1 Tax=Salinigranum marinum TaxID=1515595 RepID=UPI002989A39E|nr:hypothetical protein [Salinigranum marinum]